MANVYDKLKEMNLTLPTPPAKGGLYTPVMEFGDHLLYCSGCGPQINGTSINGKLGKDLTVEQGQEAPAGQSGRQARRPQPHQALREGARFRQQRG